MKNYIGTIINNKYLIQEIVGIGGMAIVFGAIDVHTKQKYAIKILKDEYLKDKTVKDNFKNEFKIISELNHKNIMKTYDYFFGENICYIVIEYVDGITLKEYINKQHCLTWNEACYLFIQILDAIQYAHNNGIIHRDIKSDNILLTSDGSVKLTDFGISIFARRNKENESCGTLKYMSPEQLSGNLIEEQSDVYSAGVVFYEMLTGKLPFEGHSYQNIKEKILNMKPIPLKDYIPFIPDSIENICLKSLNKNPQDRFISANEMKYELLDTIKICNTEHPEHEVDIQQEVVDNKNSINDVRKTIFIGLGIVIICIALVIGIFSKDLYKKQYFLEDYIGKNYNEIIENNNLPYEINAIYEKTDKHTPGAIIGQNPKPKTKILEGSSVTLTVAAPLDGVMIPNLYNLKENKAITILKKIKLNDIQIEYINDEFVSKGNVIYSKPNFGVITDENTDIILYVSSGKPEIPIKTYICPDVINMTKDGAVKFLNNYGLYNIVFKYSNNLIPKDIILSQNISPGKNITDKQSLILTVSTGVIETTSNILTTEETTSTTTETTTSSNNTSSTSPPIIKKSILKIILPTCTNDDNNFIKSNLKIKIADKTLKKDVWLNGKTEEFNIEYEPVVENQCIISINDINCIETLVLSDADIYTLDLSKYSFHNQTTNDASNN